MSEETHDDAVFESLLEATGVSEEELKDPREGPHDGTLFGVDLVENSPTAVNRHALIITFGGMEDSEGRDFQIDHRVNVPTNESDDWVKRLFLATLHDLGIVKREDKRARFAENDEARDAFKIAIATREGIAFPVNIYTNNAGYVNLRIARAKKVVA